ncbi:S-layer homology domain-containing protein [Lentibacillus cibarius]|uniref:S-layer homology domain-containing protein n=1 Tax=Lentibacillus cibarius TaxID=2583219 RepID=A0A549YFP2_9BACI|nr:S-layer homology domain-containing protein [Lentibacillus cibarius]TRM10711.1 S-layer homology domain-containing protein [Lentibacillus cibarius]
MADQKNYRKFAASSLAATAAVAVVAPAVSADSVSFTDVQEGDSHYEGIMALAEQGIVAGYEDGSFGVYDNVTRQQVAVMLANALELDTPADVDSVLSVYDDVDADSLYAEQIAAVTEAGAFVGNNGEFNPNADITREQMASVLVSGLGLDEYDDGEDVDINLDNVSPSHEANVQVLANLGLTVATDDFRPKEEISRGAFATMLHGALNPDSAKQAITDVSALTDDGHVLSVDFNKPMSSIDKADISIYKTASLERVGVESVELAANGKSAEILLYDNTNENAKDEIERLVQYTMQIGDLETTFVREEFLDDDDDARVTDVDSEDRKATISYVDDNNREKSVTLDVPEDSDFNFQEALGQEIAVWYDEDDNITDFNLITHEEVVYDAIEVTDKDEVETIDEEIDYDLADDVQFFVNNEAGSKNDEVTKKGHDEVEDLEGNKYDYAKLIFDDNGDVARVYAYDLAADPVLVDEVDGDIAIGADDNELDLEDYVIVKDGKQISIDDIEKGDLIFFNEDAHDDGLAVVYNNTLSGEIENVFEDSFEIDGEKFYYEPINSNIVTRYLDDGDFETLDEDEALELQAGGDVTVYLNQRGEAVYVKGDREGIDTNDNYLYLQDGVEGYFDNLDNPRFEIEGVNKDGNNKLYDFGLSQLDQITVLKGENGNDSETEYEIDKDFPGTDVEIDDFEFADEDGNVVTKERDNIVSIVAVDDNDDVIGEVVNLKEYYEDHGDGKIRNILNVIEDDDGNVDELEFNLNSELLEEDIDEDDNFANGQRINNNTLVYDLSDAGDDLKDPDTDDVDVATWGDLKENGIDINKGNAVIYYDEDGDITQIVSYENVVADENDVVALITDVAVQDGDVVRIDALVEGEKVTYDVDDSDLDVEEGEFYTLEVNDAGTVVTGKSDDQKPVLEDMIVKDVRVGAREIEFFGDSTVYELQSSDAVYDATDDDKDDWSVESLRDIDAGDEVSLTLTGNNSRFAEALQLKVEDAEDPEDYEEEAVDVSVEDATATAGDESVDVTYSVDNVDETLDLDFTVEDEDGNEVATAAEEVTEDVDDATATIDFDEALEAGDYEITATIDGEEATAELVVEAKDENAVGTVKENGGNAVETGLVTAVRIPNNDDLNENTSYAIEIDENQYELTYNSDEDRFEAELSSSFTEDDVESGQIVETK